MAHRIVLCSSRPVSYFTTRWQLSSSEEIPVLAWLIKSKARNQVVSGSYCFAEALQLGCLHDRAGCECDLMATAAALISPKAAAVDAPVLVALATRATQAIRPATILQGSLTLLVGALMPLALKQGETLLELNAAACHERSSLWAPV